MKPDRRTPFESRWRERFLSFASDAEDDAGIAGWSTTGLETRLRNFSRLWRGTPAGAMWLDAGCGAGTYTRFLARHGAFSIGLDYSYPSVQKAQTRDDTGCAWGVADVTHLPVKAGSFHGALCFGVIQALADAAPAVRELAAAVKPGGEVWIDGLNAWCLPHVAEKTMRRMQGKPPHVRYEFPERLRRLMREAGLLDVRLHWLPILPGRFHRFQWLLETNIVRWFFRFSPLSGRLFSHAFVVHGRKPA